MTDSYSSTQGNRLLARIPAALLVLVVALLFAAPATAQTLVYQFTGNANGEINDVAFTNKLVRIEFRGDLVNRFTGAVQGDLSQEAWVVPDVGGITIIVDGVPYLIDETNITLRRPDSSPIGDESSFEFADGIPLAANLEYPGLAFHWEVPGAPNNDSEFLHYFKGDGAVLTPAETDLLTVQNNLALLPEEQNRGGTGSDIGYPIDGGGKIEIDFINVGGNVTYNTFNGAGGLDYGDAPDLGAGTGPGDYNTLAASGGPAHFIGGPVLGPTVDSESGTLQDATATADDLDTGDDEDGVLFPISIVASAGTINTSSVAVNVTGAAGTLDAWFDYDQDGMFETSEKAIDGVAVALGDQLVPFTIPAGATPGTTFARFRISTAGASLPIGAVGDGEVEDYEVTILDGSGPVDIDVDLGSGGTLIQPITIWKDPLGNTEVFDGNPTTLFKAPFPAIDELDVTGTSDPDDFIVDYVNGNVANGPITIDGGTPGAGDNITLSNGTQDTIHHTYATDNDGTIAYSLSPGPPFETITYVEIEELYDELDAINRIFSFNAGPNIVDFDFVSGGPSVISTTPVTSAPTEFNGPSLPGANVVINGGTGDDEFYVEPSDEYPITVNGDDPTGTLVGDVFELDSASLGGGYLLTLTEYSNVDGQYSFTGPGTFYPVTYYSMEDVNLRFSDPNAFAGDQYPGDYFYPIHTETGISVEPYFNWDIDNWPTVGPSSLTTLTLLVSENSDLSAPIFSTTTWEDNVTPLLARVDPIDGDDDHYVTDIDRAWNSVFPLENDSRYYWALVADLLSGDTFQQFSRFDTVQELEPELDYPDDELTLYTEEVLFNWNVESATQPDVYWRMDLDINDKASFVGATPVVMGGDAFNDNDTDPADGFADETEFDADDLPTPLTWGTTYSWRVTTMWPVPPTGWVPQEVFDRHETDRAVTFSEISEFSMVTKAIQPTPSYPIGGQEVPTNTPELNWWVGGPFDNLTFDIEIREEGTMVAVCNIPTWPTGVTGLQYDTDDCDPALVPGTTYEWRVRSDDGTNVSGWSDWEEFTPQGQGMAGPAYPSYPVDGLEIYTINPQFHWFTEQDNTGIGFVAHYLQRVGPPAASCAAIKADGGSVSIASDIGVTHVDVTNLEPGATYDWCVTSTGLNGSFESGVATFEVAGGMDKNFPVASWPVGNPTVYEKDQILHWYLEGSYFDWTSFDVEYCVAPDTFGDPGCTTVTGITEQQLEVTGFDYGDEVTWRVRAHYTSGPISDWTNPASQGSFTIVGLLSTLSAELTHPVNDKVLFDNEVTFSWYVSGATDIANYFKIQYSYTETFSTIGNITIEIETPNEYLTVDDLIPGHVYWWRVAVSTDGGTTYGAWSSVASFAIDPGASAPMPRIGGPTNLVGVATTSPTLSWLVPAPSSSEVVYDVRYASNADFSGDVTEVTDLNVPFVRLQDLTEGEYYWQVRSRTVDGSSVSPYSAMGRFSTTASFSVDTEEAPDAQLPNDFELGQNYPNPFNPTTTIEYRMAESAHVTLKVYNMLGQVVKTLVNGTMPVGTHRVEWDATDDAGTAVSTGVYMYRMETGGQSAARTLVLMK